MEGNQECVGITCSVGVMGEGREGGWEGIEFASDHCFWNLFTLSCSFHRGQ